MLGARVCRAIWSGHALVSIIGARGIGAMHHEYVYLSLDIRSKAGL